MSAYRCGFVDLSQEALETTQQLLLAVFCTTATKSQLACSGKPAPVEVRF